MRKLRIISCLLSVFGIFSISVGIMLNDTNNIDIKYKQIDIKNMAASTNMIVKNNKNVETNDITLTEVAMETAPASIIIPPRVEVYDGLTLYELAEKINRNIGNDYIAGKGYLIASECISRGVDPYIAVAIMLHETGCKSSCSYLTRTCNNVGGQKGAPGCNGGSYKAFATLDEGIIGFISNLQNNYFSVGLNTIETIAPRYAESSAWPAKIAWYVEQIKAN